MRGWVLLLVLLLLAPSPAASASRVLLISMDGVRHDSLERPGLPAFQRMAREGLRAEGLVPIFPASTFPSHTALATGAHADRHGIVANRFLDPKLGVFDYRSDASFLQAEPIWATAERQGVVTAVFFWVGSETAWHGWAATHRRRPFDAKLPESEKVDQILAWLDLPEPARPRLVLSWWHGTDSAGHRFGPDSPQVWKQLQRQDRQLGRLLAGLDQRRAWAETTLLVVSDHGMAAIGKALDLRPLLERAGIRARVFHAGGLANIHLADRGQLPQVLSLLSKLPGVRAFPREQLPARLRYRSPRAGDVVALTDPPLHFSRVFRWAEGWRRITAGLGRARGGHGYDPARVPQMQGILLALGRGVAPGSRLGLVASVDVAPTVCRLLGISPPARSEGHPIAAIGPP